MTDDEKYEDLLANIKAVDIVVRSLFTRWAQEADDPKASAFRMIEGMIGSLHAITDDATPDQARVIGKIEDHLRDFGHHVDAKLSGLSRR